MSWESKSGAQRHRLDTPGVFSSDSGGWRMTLGNFNFRLKVSSGWQHFPAKMFLKWCILLDKSSATNDLLDLAFVRSTKSFTSLLGWNEVGGLPRLSSLEVAPARPTKSFTSLPGGNKIDGLPPESSYRPRCVFFCRGMGFLETDKFISSIHSFLWQISWVRVAWSA